MIGFKAIQTSFPPTKHGPLQRRELLSKGKKSNNLFLCKSNNSNSEAPPPEGDTQKQEMLARIAMLQTQKVRLTDYLDERSAYLTQFAEETNAEFDQIEEDALKGLDEASARIMENIESRMQAFEESVELNKGEIEKNKEKLAEFEGQIERDRNEGMFFQNLGQRAPSDKAKSKVEVERIKELTIGTAGSKTRRNIYLALIALVILGIVDSLISSSSNWPKIALLAAILVGLVSQYIYEQRLLSEKERIQTEETNEEKD